MIPHYQSFLTEFIRIYKRNNIMVDDLWAVTHIPFPFTGNIYRSPMPFSSYDRFEKVWYQYIENEISFIVVLAESQECRIHAKINLISFYRSKGLDVYHLPISDFQVPPDRHSLEDAITVVKNSASQGINIAVHCLAGLGRSGLFLSCLGKRSYGYDGFEAIAWIQRFIPGALENSLQEKFVIEF